MNQSPFQKLKLAITLNKYAKVDIKVLLSCLILLNFFTLFKIFCPGLSDQRNFWSQLGPVSSNPQFLEIFYNFKAFLRSLIKI